MTLQEYLQSIRIQLAMQSKSVDQIVTEIEQHLKDQIRQHQINGIALEQAEQLACAEFGEPIKVAQRFNKTYSHPLHSFWRVVGVALAVYTLIRFLVDINFFISMGGVGSHTHYMLEPDFYYTTDLLFSCLGLVGLGFLMARFIYHYLEPLNVSLKARQLSRLLAISVVIFFHVALSMIQCLISANLLYFDRFALYIISTTLVLLFTMQITFWWMQKRAGKESVILKTVHSLFSNL